MGVFTKKFDSIVDSVISSCTIYPGVDFSKGEKITKTFKTDNAVWDTGANETMITKKIVKELGLKPFDQVQVSGFHGIETTNVYLIHIGLPTGDAVVDIEAMECQGEDYDVIIGMDVISQGDFAFTNANDESVFSFRLPAKEHIELKD